MTERTGVSIECEFLVDFGGSRDEFHDHGERVMQELLKLERCNPEVTDAAVGTDFTAREISISLLVLVADEVEALRTALHVIRTAVHAAGGATHSWPKADELLPGSDDTAQAPEYRPPKLQLERAHTPTRV